MLGRLPAIGLFLLLGVALLIPSPRALSQVQDGATMTVLRGQVAVLRPDGSAVQPAPTGTVIRAGDEIRTLSATGALVTFFTGTEIEMGEDTILVVERVSRQGDRVDVALKQAFGATLNRVQTLADPGSTYQIQAGGAVALVRGTTFSVLGPYATAKGTVVVLVCLEDCTRFTTFAGVPLAPFTGFYVQVDHGQVVGSVQTFKVDRALGYWQNLWEGATTFEQTEQGDTRGRPAGQVPAGLQAEIREQLEREDRERKKKDEQPAGPGTLRGLVKNAATGQPLPGATVEVVGAAAGILPDENDENAVPLGFMALSLAAPSTTTDSNGRFTVTNVPVGDQVVRFSAPGFESASVGLNVVSGENPEIVIGLSPLAVMTATPTPTQLLVATATATATLVPATTTPTATATLTTTVIPTTAATPTATATSTATTAPTPTATSVPPTLSISDASVTEGNGGTTNAVFTVSLSALSSQAVTVNFATADGTASAGSCGATGGDYQSATGTLTIPPGTVNGTISIPICGDALDEANETFLVGLSAPTNATIANGQATGTILDDDAAPTLSIGDVSASEGAGTAVFTVTLSVVSGQTVAAGFVTTDGTATAGSDYGAISGTLTFAPGTATQTITVAIINDTLDEVDETFLVTLFGPTNATIADGQATGTILDDDVAPTLSVSDASVTEGTTPCCSGVASTVGMGFTVTLSAASGQTVTVDVATQDATATGVGTVPPAIALCVDNGTCDYVFASTTLSFSPGEMSKTFTVQVISDRASTSPPCEANETFLVNLTNAANATYADNQGVGTIVNDDTSLYCP